MKVRFALVLLLSIFLFACKKNEQSCSDGIFDPEYEEETDCGGVCPPCNYTPTPMDQLIIAKLNGKEFSFSEHNLVKNPNWILHFENDTIDIKLNFGDGDSLGVRPINQVNTSVSINSKNYTDLVDGKVLFADIDHQESKLSGYFDAILVNEYQMYDTLHITIGEFHNLKW